ncbi:dynein heavy chain domain-containing protein 1 [Eudromia elegans]
MEQQRHRRRRSHRAGKQGAGSRDPQSPRGWCRPSWPLPGADEGAAGSVSRGSGAASPPRPLHGTQVCEALLGSPAQGPLRCAYLNVAPGGHLRPYELVLVPRHRAEPQHYVFSSLGVLHVHPAEGARSMTLAEWRRQAGLWQALRRLPLLRRCLERRAFASWRKKAKRRRVRRSREALGGRLLLAVPPFAAALLHVSRLLQELQAVHWLPQDDSTCFTFAALQLKLVQENSRAQGLLRRFLVLSSAILELVRDDTYATVRALQKQVQGCRLCVSKESLYKERLRYEGLQRSLRRAESWLQRLGVLAKLTNLLICQTLVSIVQQEVTGFVSRVLQADGTRRQAVLGVLLVFDADSRLVPHPSREQLRSCLTGALARVVDADCAHISRGSASHAVSRANVLGQEQSPSLCRSFPVSVKLAGGRRTSLKALELRQRHLRAREWQQLPKTRKGPMLLTGCPSELPRSQSTEERCDQEPQLVLPVDVKAARCLEVTGHQVRGHYPLPSWDRLSQDLYEDECIQKASTQQQALLEAAIGEVQEICEEHEWVAEIHRFTRSWSAAELERMRGWPAEDYVRRVTQLRAWAERIQAVPSSIVTCNRLLLVDCSSIQEEIGPLLLLIPEEILSLLRSEAARRSRLLLAELGGIVQLYRSVGTDILMVAKCSHQLEQYEGRMEELQGKVQYVRALNAATRQCFRELSPEEEGLESTLVDTWEAFVHQQQNVSDFIASRRLTIVEELSESMLQSQQELQELLVTVTSGRFVDPSQNPCAIEKELHELQCHVQATETRLAELRRSQVILTGDCTDLSLVAEARAVVGACGRAWRLLHVVSEQIRDWKGLPFTKLNYPLAMERMAEWQRELVLLEGSLSAEHAVWRTCTSMVAGFRGVVPLLQKLSSPLIKTSAWREIFMAMGLTCPINLHFTVGQLMSYPLLEHHSTICRIWSNEQAHHSSRDMLHQLQKTWRGKNFRLTNFILKKQAAEFSLHPASQHQPSLEQEYISKDSGTYILSVSSLRDTSNCLPVTRCDTDAHSEPMASFPLAYCLLIQLTSHQCSCKDATADRCQSQDTTELKVLTERSLLTLQNMVCSLHGAQIQEEVENWIFTLRTFDMILDMWIIFQQKWIFLNKVLYEMDIVLSNSDLDHAFQQQDGWFRELMQVTYRDPLVLSSVVPAPASRRESQFVGVALHAMLSKGAGDLQSVVSTLHAVLESACVGFPRLFFLSSAEVVAVVAAAPEPAEVTAWACRCFPGVRSLAFGQASVTSHDDVLTLQPLARVCSLVGACGETVPLDPPLQLTPGLEGCLRALERRMQDALSGLLQACVAESLALRPLLDECCERRAGGRQPAARLLAEHWGRLAGAFPAQCVLLADAALWCRELEERLWSAGPQRALQLQQELRVQALAGCVRSARAAHPGSARRHVLLGALLAGATHQRDVLARLLERKVSSPTAFEWAAVLKYRVTLHPEWAGAAAAREAAWATGPPDCWAEILGARVPYGYEYVGPSSRVASSPLLERGVLGLLLALEDFRCAAALGRCGAGKSEAVRGLSRALGRHLVVLHCSPRTELCRLRRLLRGLGRLLSNLQAGCAALPGKQRPAAPGGEEERGAMAPPLPPAGGAAALQPGELGRVLFEGSLISVRETYGCLATMQRLPEPLQLAVRPVAVLAPEPRRVLEASLLAAGFQEAARLAEKLAAFLQLEPAWAAWPGAGRLALLQHAVRAAADLLSRGSAGAAPEATGRQAKEEGSFQLPVLEHLSEEQALVQALCSSPLLRMRTRESGAWELLRGVFPASCSGLREAQEPAELLGAAAARLQEDGLSAAPELAGLVGELHQALLASTAVLLVGPAGSGKTTAWRTLARLLSQLAMSKACEAASRAGRPRAGEGCTFLAVSALCLCPNSLSTAELLGGPEEGAWREGVFPRLLQKLAASAPAAAAPDIQQWLVVDGSPSAEWLEPVASLLSGDGALSLPDGRQLQCPRSTRLLLELPDISSVSPSVLTRCALVPFQGSGLWQALLASALAPVSSLYSVARRSVAALRGLAEDVFPATLAFLQQNCCSALHAHTELRRTVAHGMSEVSAFTRILKALLDQLLWRDGERQPLRARSLPVQARTCSVVEDAFSCQCLDDSVPAHHHQLSQSIFVIAYVWGFGGHLQPRYNPGSAAVRWYRERFDCFARRVLYNSRHRVELPPACSAFDLYPHPGDGRLRTFDRTYLHSRVKGIPMTFSVLPQYEQTLYMVDLLLGSQQPVLLTGEPGCGKSAFVETLVAPVHPYQRTAVSPLLSAGHLRQLLESKILGQAPRLAQHRASISRSSRSTCLLLLEDLHMAAFDPKRTGHPVAETLRQALSHQEVYSTTSLELQHFSSAQINYLVTVAAPVADLHPLSPRLIRLFSVLSLPAVTKESLVSCHIVHLQSWLEKFPFLCRQHELATALVAATVDLYEAVRSKFCASPARCPSHFSFHHIDKVLKSMLMLQPSPRIHLTSPLEEPSSTMAAKVSSPDVNFSMVLSTRVVVRLWLHESLRTFCDPLATAHEQQQCGQLVLDVARNTFCSEQHVLKGLIGKGQRSRAGSVERAGGGQACGEANVEEDIQPESEEEPGSESSSDSECLDDAWDPVEQAPALALDPENFSAFQGSVVRLLVPGVAEVAGKASSAHLAVNQHGCKPGIDTPKSQFRHCTRRDTARPLLPPHLLLRPGEDLHDVLFSILPALASSSHDTQSLYQERQWDTIQQQLSTILPRDFMLGREVTVHFVRLLRVLSGQERHGALISFHLCTGRRSLVALAAHVMAAQLFELNKQAEAAEVRELVRKACWEAGVQGRQTVLLVHQGADLSTMQKVLMLMREGTYPDLHSPEDMASIVRARLLENQGMRKVTQPDVIIRRFHQLVKSNLHVLLLLDGHSGQLQSWQPFGLPPATVWALLSMSCSTELYRPWSHAMLQQMAAQHLEEALSQQPLQRQGSLHDLEKSLVNIATVMASIHCSARCYAEYLASDVPLVTPKTFLDFLDIFLLVSARFHRRFRQQMDQVKQALAKMKEVSQKQETCSQHIAEVQRKLIKIKESLEWYRQCAGHKKAVLAQEEQDCQDHKARMEVLTREHDVLVHTKETALKQMTTDYQAARAELTMNHIEELRSYRAPPEPLIHVTDVLCRMFKREPGWESARQLLGQETFYQELLSYPKEELSNELLDMLDHAMSSGSLSVTSLRHVSIAAAALCQWICAIYRYCQALAIWQPTVLQLQHCQLQIQSEKGWLDDQRLQAARFRKLSHGWTMKLKHAIENKKLLLRELTHSLKEKEAAAALETFIAEHVVNYTAAAELLEQRFSTIPGDAVLCAAALAYLGAFPPRRRQELLEKWRDLCAGCPCPLEPDDMQRLIEKELPSPNQASSDPILLPVRCDFDLLALLSSAREQRAWDQAGKPQSPDSRHAALMLHAHMQYSSHFWPLILDPDQQALTWLDTREGVGTAKAFLRPDLLLNAKEPRSAMELPKKSFRVLSASDPNLEQNLLSAADSGSSVLLMDLEKGQSWRALLQLLQMGALPPMQLCLSTALPLSVLREGFRSVADSRSLCTNGSSKGRISARNGVVEGETEHCEVKVQLPGITAHTGCAEMDPALLKQVKIIDLSLSQEDFEALLLQEILHVEQHDAKARAQMIQRSVCELEDKLEDTEEALLDLVSQAPRPLLEEENFLPMLQMLNMQLTALRTKHDYLLGLQTRHADVQARYQQLARLGAGLHEALQQLCCLHPLYHCSARTSLAVMRTALLAVRRMDTIGQEPQEAQLAESSRAVAQQFLEHAQAGLQDRHRPLLGLLGALVPLRLGGQLGGLEWMAFCRGLRGPAAGRLLRPTEVARPAWVSHAAWRECGRLERLPPFTGLRASLAARAAQWQEYFCLPSTVVGPAPMGLGLFQRAVLWRIFRPAQLSRVLEELAACLLGWPRAATSPIVARLCHRGQGRALLLLAPPHGAATHPLHWIRALAAQQHRAEEVTVVALGCAGSAQRVSRALQHCAGAGRWLVLDNCHLQEEWPPALLAMLGHVLLAAEATQSCPMLLQACFSSLQTRTSHHSSQAPDRITKSMPNSGSGSSLPPVTPVLCQVAAVFWESPLDPKALLLHSYAWVRGQPSWPGPQKHGLALLVLHAALLHRQLYGRRLQASCYLWTESEFLAALHAWQRLPQQLSNPGTALAVLAGSVLYGGHILDEGDAAAVQSLAQECLDPVAPLLHSPGLQSLLTPLQSCCRPGVPKEEASEELQRRMEQLPSPMAAASCGAAQGLQDEVLAARSRALLCDLRRCQELWQPPPPPPSPRQEALRQLAEQGLALIVGLQQALQLQGWEVGARNSVPAWEAKPRPGPLHQFLLQECGSFLVLLQQLEKDLSCVQERLRGGSCPSPRCSAILWALHQGRLPQPWRRWARTGPRLPGKWLQSLESRCQLLCSYLEAVGGQPVLLYHLSAFLHPRRLPWALLQEAALTEKQEFEQYHLKQQVLPSLLPPATPPETGLLLTGLEVHNGSWDMQAAALQDTDSVQPCPLPPLWIRAVHKEKPSAAASTQAEYQCPIFLGRPHEPGCLGSRRAVLHVVLPCKVPPSLCTQRRMHIVSHLPCPK